MRRVLIVSPSFPPKNSADLHRVRTSLPYYREFGWEPTVLCLTPETSEGPDDPMLARTVPTDIEIVRVPAWDARTTRRFGFGSNDQRGLLPLYRAGRALLQRRRHDVVFFSTTSFLTFLLGPPWKRRFGCKVVFDMQDPWVHEQPAYDRSNVPGAWWKYRVNRWLAPRLERRAFRCVDHVISVSPGYVRDLSSRYPWLDQARFTVLPFGADRRDYDVVRDHAVRQSVFGARNGMTRWVYAGRGGPDMSPVLAALFKQLAALRKASPALTQNLRLHFVGTNYSPPERTYKVVEPLAREHGVADLVEERSTRIPFHETLALYSDSDGILLIGSIAAEYTASKLFNCVMAGKPVLALFHRDSLVNGIAQQFPNVRLATFAKTPEEPEFGAAIARGIEWLRAARVDVSGVADKLQPWSAKELTRIQCAVFDHVADGGDGAVAGPVVAAKS